jgi:hypothetical protein
MDRNVRHRFTKLYPVHVLIGVKIIAQSMLATSIFLLSGYYSSLNTHLIQILMNQARRDYSCLSLASLRFRNEPDHFVNVRRQIWL